MDTRIRPLSLRDIRVTDPFWVKRIDTARAVAIPYMLDALHDRIPGVPASHCVKNFEIAAGLSEGAFGGYVFQDSDLYKWFEGVAYALETNPDPALEKTADGLIEIVGKAQRPDGYLDTYYILNGLDKRWMNLSVTHELYVAGHLMEAAVAYAHATGKRALLDIACRFADHIDAVFGPGEHQKHGYPGHQEVELGLVKLYEATGEERYLRLASYFLLERGKQPHYFESEAEARGEAKEDRKSFHRNHGYELYSYQQAHKPVLEQTEAVGHAVREGYMLSGMADVAALTGNAALLQATRTLYDDITDRQMYITGGIGSMSDGEAFTFDYDLPNDRMYTETCASISLLMTAQRLLNIEPDSRHADVCERTLYNGILSGISLDGTKYFYVNPLEVWPDRCNRRVDMHVDAERQGWFGCACCPPNVLRTMTGIGQYLYGVRGTDVYVHQYVASEADIALPGGKLTLRQAGSFPWEESIRFTFAADAPVDCRLWLRIPGWCKRPSLLRNGKPAAIAPTRGYLLLDGSFGADDVLELTLPMPAERVYCADNVPFNAGRVALMRGPLVYCVEQEDNGDKLWNLRLTGGEIRAEYRPDLLGGVVALTANGAREHTPSDALYATAPPVSDSCTLTFVPYYAWCNRTPGEMMVWVRG